MKVNKKDLVYSVSFNPSIHTENNTLSPIDLKLDGFVSHFNIIVSASPEKVIVKDYLTSPIFRDFLASISGIIVNTQIKESIDKVKGYAIQYDNAFNILAMDNRKCNDIVIIDSTMFNTKYEEDLEYLFNNLYKIIYTNVCKNMDVRVFMHLSEQEYKLAQKYVCDECVTGYKFINTGNIRAVVFN